MNLTISIARFVLAAILILAGVSKFVDRNRTRKTLKDFGFDEEYLVPATWLLPLLELLAGASLLYPKTAWVGAILAFVLFVAFSLGIGYNLRLGRKPECNCFGQMHSSAIGLHTLLRSLIFALLAAAVVWKTDTGVVGPLTEGERSLLLLSVLILLSLGAGFWLLMGVAKLQHELTARMDEMGELLLFQRFPGNPGDKASHRGPSLPIGVPAPDFNLPNIEGGSVGFQELLVHGKPLLLFFLSVDCGPCSALAPEIRLWQLELKQRASFATIVKGSLPAIQAKFGGKKAGPVLHDELDTIGAQFSAKWYPAVILIKADGSVGSQVAFGDREIRALFKHFTDAGESSPWFSKRDHEAEEQLQAQTK